MNVQVILTSTRPGRIGDRVATWVMTNAKQVDGFKAELVDMADYALPHFDEVGSPRYNPKRQPSEVPTKWLAKLSEADAYIVITPEYNHSITGILKDGLDYLDSQLAKKPVAIVSYGSVGGARAAEQLKGILIESRAAVVPEAVALMNPSAAISPDGELNSELLANPYGPQFALDNLLTELNWWGVTLKAGRENS